MTLEEKIEEIKDNIVNQANLCSVGERQGWRYFDEIGWLWCTVLRHQLRVKRTRSPERAKECFGESGEGRHRATSYLPFRSGEASLPRTTSFLVYARSLSTS
ncbi:hypothetical protein OIU84_012525 [Salix udensis]|uniref:Uncharacterized protein n=1 Tax=Salix udensis TaxID=889485 RepID=A0AAD6JFS9_9ROSI|nr:hypothetical protein OIU84_012525 [Salix udensis]